MTMNLAAGLQALSRPGRETPSSSLQKLGYTPPEASSFVPLLPKLGANPDIKILDYGSIPLHKAAFGGNPGIVQTLLKGGANS